MIHGQGMMTLITMNRQMKKLRSVHAYDYEVVEAVDDFYKTNKVLIVDPWLCLVARLNGRLRYFQIYGK